MISKTFRCEQDFSSLGECLRFVRKEFPQQWLDRRHRNIEGDRFHAAQQSRMLFRGEVARFPTTVSSRRRLKENLAVSESAKSEILELTSWAESQLADLLKVPHLFARGYCQHYGLPTDFLDFTSSLEVAAVFSGLQRSTSDELGLLGVLRYCCVALPISRGAMPLAYS